jgi:sialate O-acetylesterase
MVKQLKLCGVFTNHMVVQRDMEFPVWGSAAEGAAVRVEFGNQSRITTAVNGKWKVTFSPVDAGGPYILKVTDGSVEILVHDILVGEVWIAGGQSNMEFQLNTSLDGDVEAAAADYPGIRYFDVPRIAVEEKSVKEANFSTTRNTWEVCTPETAGHFSAVAFHFAKQIHRQLNIPVGVIGCNWGGTSASCWMSREALSEDAGFKTYLDEYAEEIKDLQPEDYEKALKEYGKAVQSYNTAYEKAKLEQVDPARIGEVVGAYPWPPPKGPRDPMRPAGLYYTMLQKITPYAVKGVIWYQGESDACKPVLYRRLFSRMIQLWRADFHNPALPFLFVQLTAFGCDGNPEGEDWAQLRESQMHVAQNVKHTGMIVSIDCGDRNDIHPIDKRPLGERLALLAGNKVYDRRAEYSGPVYTTMEVKGDKAVLYFDHVGEGLTMQGERLTGFKICGDDRIFVDAQAAIKGDTVEVFSSEVGNPIAVRYGWLNCPDLNLYNRDGLPAGPFRTDSSGNTGIPACSSQ